MTRAHGPLESKAAKGSPGTRLREHEHFRSPRRTHKSTSDTLIFISLLFTSRVASTNESPEAWAQDKMIDKISLIWAHTHNPFRLLVITPRKRAKQALWTFIQRKKRKRRRDSFRGLVNSGLLLQL